MGCPLCNHTGWRIDPETNAAKKCQCLVEKKMLKAEQDEEFLPTEDPDDTLRDARLKLISGMDQGVGCPVCGQLAKRYKRKFNSQMGRFLIALFGATKDADGWASSRDFLNSGHKASSDGSYLVYWDLVERKDKQSGEYRLLPKGERFALGRIRVPRHCYIFNGRRVRFSKDSTNIQEALGDHFDYGELMGWTTSPPPEPPVPEDRLPYRDD